MKLSRKKLYRLDDGRVVIFPGDLGPFYHDAPYNLVPLHDDRPRSLPTGAAYVITRPPIADDEIIMSVIADWCSSRRLVQVYLICEGIELTAFSRELRSKQLSAPGRGDAITVLTPVHFTDRQAAEYVLRSIAELGYATTFLTSTDGPEVAVLVRRQG